MSKPITREREDLRDELTEARAEIAMLKAEVEWYHNRFGEDMNYDDVLALDKAMSTKEATDE